MQPCYQHVSIPSALNLRHKKKKKKKNFRFKHPIKYNRPRYIIDSELIKIKSTCIPQTSNFPWFEIIDRKWEEIGQTSITRIACSPTGSNKWSSTPAIHSRIYLSDPNNPLRLLSHKFRHRFIRQKKREKKIHLFEHLPIHVPLQS